MKEIILTKGFLTVVDDIDYEPLMAMGSWYTHNSNTKLYALKRVSGKLTRMHRVIMRVILGRDLVRGEFVDHINLDSLDNRRDNLRLATIKENCRNCKISKNNTSGYNGVTWDKSRQKWSATIMVDRCNKYLGRYNNPIEAAIAYNNGAIKYFGEFARLNDIPQDYVNPACQPTLVEIP